MAWTDRIGRRLKLHDLHVLVATVEAGSMGQAAQVLNTSQPAVSRAIADLEAALGVTPLDRGPRGIEPTVYGRALLDSAAAAFDSLRAGVNRISAMAGAAAGEIRIGGNEAIIAALLPQALPRLRAQYPNVSVSVRHVVSVPQQYRELRERRLDVILGRVTLPADEDTEADVLYREPTYVVAGANSRWARRRARFAFSELADEPWALPLPNTLVGALFSDAFSAQGLTYPPRGAVLGSIHLHCALVASGQYLAVMPASVVRRNGALFGLRTLPVDSPVPASPVGVLALRRRDLLPVVRDFIASVRESVSDLHAEPGD